MKKELDTKYLYCLYSRNWFLVSGVCSWQAVSPSLRPWQLLESRTGAVLELYRRYSAGPGATALTDTEQREVQSRTDSLYLPPSQTLRVGPQDRYLSLCDYYQQFEASQNYFKHKLVDI